MSAYVGFKNCLLQVTHALAVIGLTFSLHFISPEYSDKAYMYTMQLAAVWEAAARHEVH